MSYFMIAIFYFLFTKAFNVTFLFKSWYMINWIKYYSIFDLFKNVYY